MYDDVLEQIGQLGLTLNDPKTATIRVLFELCKQNREQTTSRVVDELYEMSFDDRASLLDQMPGPDECYLPEPQQSAAGEDDLKLLNVAQSKKRCVCVCVRPSVCVVNCRERS